MAHDGSGQARHTMTVKPRVMPPTDFARIQLLPNPAKPRRRVQANIQLWQPTQRSESITASLFVISPSFSCIIRLFRRSIVYLGIFIKPTFTNNPGNMGSVPLETDYPSYQIKECNRHEHPSNYCNGSIIEKLDKSNTCYKKVRAVLTYARKVRSLARTVRSPAR